MKINNISGIFNINNTKKAEIHPKTKPMPMDSVSFSGIAKTQTNDEKFVALRDEISVGMQEVLQNEEAAAWDFYINSSEENLEKPFSRIILSAE